MGMPLGDLCRETTSGCVEMPRAGLRCVGLGCVEMRRVGLRCVGLGCAKRCVGLGCVEMRRVWCVEMLLYIYYTTKMNSLGRVLFLTCLSPTSRIFKLLVKAVKIFVWVFVLLKRKPSWTWYSIRVKDSLLLSCLGSIREQFCSGRQIILPSLIFYAAFFLNHNYESIHLQSQ